jgi:ATP-dependent HslUV protease subunit HslV
MTVISYRDGVMAADTGGFRGDSVMPWFRKVARGPDGSLYGGSGSAARVCEFLAWVDGGYEGDMPLPVSAGEGLSDFAVLIVRPDDRIEILSHEGCEILYGAPYVAIGACAEVCLGAMYAGGDAETAIKAALEHGNGAAGHVLAVRR